MSGESEWEQLSLVPIPVTYRTPRKRAPDAKDRWTKHRGKRVSCDVCLIDIHNGKTVRSLAAAMQVLTRGDRRWYLCHFHAVLVKSGQRRLDG